MHILETNSELSACLFTEIKIYPHLVNTFGNPPAIRKIRQQIIPLATGNVLEIGAGSGANFPYYGPKRISKLFILEPNDGMIRLAKLNLKKISSNFEFLDLSEQQIPLESESIDTVVSTFTLCTISDVDNAIRGIRRVLKPGGNLIFFEIGTSPEPKVSVGKNFEPIAHRMYEGLSLTRDIPPLLTRIGFHMEHLETGYIAKFPKSWTYCFWGNAIRSKKKRDE